MRDYFLDFVSNQSEKTQKRAIGQGAKGAEDPFVPFAPFANSEYSENSAATGSGAAQNSNLPIDEIFEERVAIMMYDGGLSEEESIQYLISNPDYSTDSSQ